MYFSQINNHFYNLNFKYKKKIIIIIYKKNYNIIIIV